MQEPFTYAYLGTIAGAAAATALVVELVKDLRPLKNFPTRWLVVAVAETITITVAWFNGLLTWDNLLLHLLNGLLAASTAMVGWHIASDKAALRRNNSKKAGEK